MSQLGRERAEMRTGSCARQCFVQIADQVVGALQADREAHDVGAGAGGFALLVGELAVGRRGGVQDEAAGVADIGEVREELHAFDELDAGLIAALDAKGEDRTRTLWQVFAREVVVRAVREPGIGDPGDAWVDREELGDLREFST